MENLPIGILGGTFDPIHLGHLHLASVMHQLCHLQKILLVPCYQSPLKTTPIASSQDRMHMVQLATRNSTTLASDNYEIKSATISYTIKTLEYLRKKNGATPLALIIGDDAFNKFNQWHQWQKILDLAHLLIANRHHNHHQETSQPDITALLTTRQTFEHQELQKKMAGLIYRVDINPLPIAATEIRNLVRQQKEIAHLVTPKVWHYIASHHLYTKE